MAKIGINVVSLFPWCMGPWGLELCLQLASEAGLDGLQVLPLRGWDLGLPYLWKWQDRIISYEDAWNFGPWYSFMLRHLGLEPTAPTWKDALLFQQRQFPTLKGSLYSTHKWNLHGMTEIHPELTPTIGDYKTQGERGQRFVWDTWHVMRPGRNGNYAMDVSWRELFVGLDKSTIGLVHLNLTGKRAAEIEFLNKRGEHYAQLEWLQWIPLEYCPRKEALPIIIELKPRAQTWHGIVERLSRIKEVINELSTAA